MKLYAGLTNLIRSRHGDAATRRRGDRANGRIGESARGQIPAVAVGRICHALPRMAALAALAFSALQLPAQISTIDITPTTTTAPGSLEWQTNLDAALKSARPNEPILLIFGAPWCEWCQKLSVELATPELQSKLAGLTRVYLDFDKNRELAKKYGVGPIPALRMLRSNGRVVAVQDGYMRAERLIAWLDDSQKAAGEADLGAVIADDAPTEASIAQIVAVFADPQAEAREAAIRRLLPYPATAAPTVVKSFTTGSLAVRLTALDLLESWKAPTSKLDPWQPDSLTKDRLDKLAAWAANPAAAAAAATQPALDQRQLADARELIDRLLAASDEAAPAIRERLARYGPALLPTIYADLKNPPSDAAKERLTLLRYRVAASDALALQWPGGLERLASPQIKIRHAALDELTKRISTKDAPLLLQLFSDPDALVRETALRLLQQVGGPGATDALAGLLKDPDPNVRAAVLKSAEEQPTPVIANQVADYVAVEKDPDLLGHAARVLRKGKGEKPLKALYTLLVNDNWRVRAEAAEALTELVGTRSNTAAEVKADFYVRMLKLLDDPDGFVASKAMTALEGADVLPDLDRIRTAAEKHPELAAQAVKLLATKARSNAKAIDIIRSFGTHKDPSVRAVTITELTAAAGQGAADSLLAGLRDPDNSVREAASGAIFTHIETLYPSSDNSESLGMLQPGAKAALAKTNDDFVADFTSGKTRPAWLNAFRADLEKALTAKSQREQIRAAMCLICLGDRAKALPVIKDLTTQTPGFVGADTEVLKWLPWDDRLALFNFLLPLAARQTDSLDYLARGMAAGGDPRAVDSLWLLLAQSKANEGLASDVASALRRIFIGSEYRTVELTAAQKKQAAADVQKILDTGNDLQRIVAMALLTSVSPEAAADAATRIRNDDKADPALRRDAFQIQLSLLTAPDGQAQAAAALNSTRPLERQLALSYLVTGTDAIRYLRDSIYLNNIQYSEGVRTGSPIVPVPPRGVTIDMLKPLLKDKSPGVVASAGYLLALLHDRSGLAPLIAFYKSSPGEDSVRRMMYRAISALDDDTYTPLLTDIYKSYGKDAWELREFYWTIRSMTGERCMALRKQMRDEVGMENLR